MKLRIVVFLIAAGLVALGLWSMRRAATTRPASKRAPAHVPASTSAGARPGGSVAEVPIQDGKTIDFSTGKPVVQDDPAQKAALARSVAEMEKAASGVTFGPVPSAPSSPPPATDPKTK